MHFPFPIFHKSADITLIDRRAAKRGFTLIELSIVLVIIGLIIGGVLVGRDLIAAATIRAQISQIEKYNTAVNTFYSKFQALPGDLNQTTASQFGFAARGPNVAQGDGNTLIQGSTGGSVACPVGCQLQGYQMGGETAMFWVDISSKVAGPLIAGSFTTATADASSMPHVTTLTPSIIAQFFPTANIGSGNSVMVVSGGIVNASGTRLDSNNYFFVGVINNTVCGGILWGCIVTNPNSMIVSQAYQIDNKIDDGLPQSGNVTATYLTNYMLWADGSFGVPTNPATTGSLTTCFDNNGNAGAVERYSLSQNNGGGVNCSLSFKMQAGG